MKVLICEDEEIMLTAIEFRLKKAGFGVLRAKNGEETVEMIKLHQPGMIVLDMVMPNTDCHKLIEHIRKTMKNDAPIVLLAPIEKDDEEVLAAFDAGIQDFVIKPFKPTELILRIKHILQVLGIELVKERLT